jgi:hypothetical protein
MQYQSSDDLLSVIPSSLDQGMFLKPHMAGKIVDVSLGAKFYLIDQLYRALQIILNYSTDEAQKHYYSLFRLAPLYKCISVQNILGTEGKYQRNMPAKLAWVTMNLRVVSFTVSMSFRHNENLKHGEQTARRSDGCS